MSITWKRALVLFEEVWTLRSFIYSKDHWYARRPRRLARQAPTRADCRRVGVGGRGVRPNESVPR